MAHVVLAGIFHHIHLDAIAPQRGRQRSRIIDRLSQWHIGVAIVTVAYNQCDPRRPTALLGSDGLGGFRCRLVERSMGADRQRRHACQGDGTGDRPDAKYEVALRSFVVRSLPTTSPWMRATLVWSIGFAVSCGGNQLRSGVVKGEGGQGVP